MGLCFRMHGGPLAGQVLEIKEGMKIGREAGDIVLPDKKVSGFHAFIDTNQTGQVVLVDNDSKNGIKVNGQRVDEVILEPGLQIEVGNSRLEVIWLTPEAATRVQKSQEAPSTTTTRRTWSEVLVKFTDKILKKAEDTPATDLNAFDPALHLTFITGLQMDTFWRLGYGPRRVGSHSLDLPVFEPKAPANCFQIFPGDDGPVFKTDHPDVVQINGASVKEGQLHKGDIISIYETSIEVDFDQ